MHALGELFTHLSKLDGIIRADKEDTVAKGIFLIYIIILPLNYKTIFNVFFFLFIVLRFGNIAIFVSVRLCTMVVAFLTFWYGLAQVEAAQFVIRVAALGAVTALQVNKTLIYY